MSRVDLKTGSRLRSRACSTEIIVVRVPSTAITLTCGGHPMVAHDSTGVDGALAPLPDWDSGTVLGKRYTSPNDDSLEVLVTKPGAGTLGDGSAPLIVKGAKPLPASD
ncbi:hypothetical protein [Nocardia carnea]|uniref:hypothetical protein n=1 Tax=Nocardia carnea TaxID=37328 RepID=UPI002456A587|nr:hypothetical protein [Nocardia carnea]